MTHLRYRLADGHVIQYWWEDSRGLTMDDIDRVVGQYFEHTYDVPPFVFLRADLATSLLTNSVGGLFRKADATTWAFNRLWTTVGIVNVCIVADAYIPFLAGSEEDYVDNDVSKIFEETVLKDCERA